MKKIIFLDIDGVVCTARSHFASGKKGIMLDWDATGCDLISQICEKTGAKIVISSTWRHEAHQQDLFSRLIKHGLWGHMFCDVNASGAWATPWKPSASRGNEIDMWIEQNGPIDEYVIIDDNHQFHGQQIERFIQTEPTNGISAEDFQKALGLFGIKTGVILL